jgi:Ca2+-transporting ATPase
VVQAFKEKFGQNEQIHKQTHKWWLALFDLSRTDVTIIDRSSGYLFCHGAK